MPETLYVIIRLEKVPYIDQTGLYALEDSIIMLEKRGIEVLFVGLQPQPRQRLEAIHLIPDLILEGQLFDRFDDWLEKFETYMVKTMGKSRTTLSMYVRTLRTVYNNALSENEIEREFYPFGKRKYQVPATKRVKKALTKAELKLMFETTPKTRGQQRAKDFWFFSFICNGMNMKDIALFMNQKFFN